MSKQLQTKKMQNGSKPQPSKQDMLDMLASWCQMATESGLQIEQLYSPKNGRFTVRVYDVSMNEASEVVVAK